MHERDDIYMPADKPPVAKWIPLSIQHVFAMFGATVLVTILTGLSVTSARFTVGNGTLVYILVTGARLVVPRSGLSDQKRGNEEHFRINMS